MERKVIYSTDCKFCTETLEVDDSNAYVVLKYPKHIMNIIMQAFDVYSNNKGVIEISNKDQEDLVTDIAKIYPNFISIQDSPSIYGNLYCKVEELKRNGILDDSNTTEICQAFISPAIEENEVIVAYKWDMCISDWYINNIRDYVKDEYKGDFIRMLSFYKILSNKVFSTKECLTALCDILTQIKKEEKKHTYIFRDVTGYYMIGHTKNVPQRYNNVRVGNTTLDLVCHLDGDYASRIHKQFANKKIEGIWFNLTKDDIDVINNLQNK